MRADRHADLHILLTGTFHSDNWIRAHLGPLSGASACRRVTMVTTTPVPELPKVRSVAPPALLARLAGDVPARLLTFVALAVRERPDVVGGFHLLVNGLVAILAGRLISARTWYFSVGGPVELLDGGVWGENAYFARLGVPDATVEGRLLEAVNAADLVVTMGSGARDFLRQHGVDTRIEIVPGGIAPMSPRDGTREFDLILVARLVPIKQIDRFLRLVRYVADRRSHTTAVIVGDGPLRASLEALARELALERCVRFAGFQADVVPWLHRSRVFVLTSRSEGVALSLMEAMTCGLPAVVPRVGDLADVVENGVNGYAVDVPTPERMGEHVLSMLQSPDRYARHASAARQSAARYSVAATTARWNAVLAGETGNENRETGNAE